jgi:hypothetical protein
VSKLNSFEENVCENANTHAHNGLHKVVLVHLQRMWSLKGGEGFEILSIEKVFLWT